MAGTIDELLPDRGPEAARQVLRAAGDIRVWDGRATAWLVLQRLLEAAGMAAFLVGVVAGSVLVGRWVWIVLGAGTLLLAFEGPTTRLAGAEPRRWPTRRRVAGFAAVVAAVVVLAIVPPDVSSSTGNWPQLGTLLVLALSYFLAPVVRWAWSLRRVAGATPWPDGAQAYAVLSVLARVQWMHRVRVAELAGMPLEQCDAWVGACAARGLVVRPARRAFLTRHPEITAAGLARLDAWTAELTQRAAGAQPCTDSTAPTSPAVSSDRSASDVT